MPIYEYRCNECQQVFEEWSKHFEDTSATRPCPICKGVSRHIISNTSFALKGGGWYTTEYGSHKGRDNGAGAKPEAQPAAGSSCAAGGCSKAGRTEGCSSSGCAAPSAS